jgi:glycosyltransferase involved in cell wall biosynthesis
LLRIFFVTAHFPSPAHPTRGRLVPPRDPASLAQAIASVLDTTWDAAAISAHGSRSWSTVAAELLEVFQSLPFTRQDAGA